MGGNGKFHNVPLLTQSKQISPGRYIQRRVAPTQGYGIYFSTSKGQKRPSFNPRELAQEGKSSGILPKLKIRLRPRSAAMALRGPWQDCSRLLAGRPIR